MSAQLKDTEATIKAMLVNDLNVGGSVDDISSQSRIRDELGVDSLGFEELRVRCEEEFDISIDDEQFSSDTFGTVESLAELVNRLQHDGGVQQ
jgi:acyl carrier protein